MDRGRAAAGGLILATVVGAGALAAPSLRAAGWLAPRADVVQALGTKPAECLKRPRSSEAAYLVEVGRAAFRSPLLLGGQAARAGVSCETCHRGGRSNPDFLFRGVSGAPGTADVTSSLFSSHRGDGVDNPKPIPDLGGSKATLKVSQAPAGRALESFIHGLVVEEFDGPEPTPAVLSGLAAYVRAMSPEACTRSARRLHASDVMAEAARAVRAADAALARHDSPTALVLLEAARSQLGLLDERYDTAELARDRAALRALDLELAAALDDVRSRRPVAARLTLWAVRADAARRLLSQDEPRSLFAPDRLRSLAARGSAKPRT